VTQRAALALAVALLAACVTEPPKNAEAVPQPNLPEAARINTTLGVDYARQGRMDLALEKLQRAIEQKPDYAPAHSALAFVYTQRGDNEAGEREYRRAIELDGTDPSIRNNFGVFLCGQGKTREADTYFMQAVQDRSYATPEAAWTNAGVCAQRAGDAVRAEADFRAALHINPNFADALSRMAAIAYQNRNYLQARAFLQRYDGVAQPTAETLWLAARNERALGDASAARRYELKLIQNFPESPETAQLLKQPAAP
jgi:type IV pilus assembly protein PilF